MADINVTQQEVLAAQQGQELPVLSTRAKLDLPVAEFELPESTASESTDAPAEATSDVPVEDTDEDEELLKLLGEDAAEDKPEEPKPDEAEFEAKFDKAFNERFGMSPDEAVELVTELVAERKERTVQAQLDELQRGWGVEEAVMRERLELVASYWAKLSPEKQAEYNSVQGAQRIYAKLELAGKLPKKLQGSSTKAAATGQPKYMYTQKQIDEMPINEYKAQADRIAYALANKLVKP